MHKRNRILIVALAISAFFTTQSFGQALARFNVKTVGNTTPTGMYYAEYLPPGFANTTPFCKYPMLMVLHGIGEKGPNDGSQLSKVTVHGPAKHIKNGGSMCFTVNGKQECFVVIAPQLDVGNWTPTRIRAHYDAVMSDPAVGPKIDSNRVYLTGLSLGAQGVLWHMINPVSNNPNVFAACAAIAGVSSPNIGCSYTAKDIPLWLFCGDKDNTAPYSSVVALNNGIQNCTSPPLSTDIRFTGYTNVGHNSWSRAFDTSHTYHNPNLYEWLLSKTLAAANNSCNNVNNLNVSQSTACLGDSITVTLTSPGFGDYNWELDGVKIPASTSTVRVAPSVGNHTLSVSATDCNCLADTTINLTVISGPIAKINAAGAPSICRGDSLFLESDTTVGNSWLLDGNLLQTGNSVYASQEGTYSLIVDFNGTCVDTTDLFVKVNDSIVPVISYGGGQLTSTIANTYQWYASGAVIAGANSQNYTPPANGVYSVRTEDTNGCYATSSDFNLTYIGIGTVKNGTFEVFPNPVSKEININLFLDEGTEAVVRIVDLKGSVIAEEVFTDLTVGWQNLKMNLNDVPYRGVALVIVSSNDASGTSRVVIK